MTRSIFALTVTVLFALFFYMFVAATYLYGTPFALFTEIHTLSQLKAIFELYWVVLEEASPQVWLLGYCFTIVVFLQSMMLCPARDKE